MAIFNRKERKVLRKGRKGFLPRTCLPAGRLHELSRILKSIKSSSLSSSSSSSSSSSFDFETFDFFYSIISSSFFLTLRENNYEL